MGDPLSDSPSPLTAACQFTCVCAAAVSDKREPRAAESPRHRREGRVEGQAGQAGGRGVGGGVVGGRVERGRAACLSNHCGSFLSTCCHKFSMTLTWSGLAKNLDTYDCSLQPGLHRAAAWVQPGCMGLQRLHHKAQHSGLGWGAARPRARATTNRAVPRRGGVGLTGPETRWDYGGGSSGAQVCTPL
jgi:hypothetical protein